MSVTEFVDLDQEAIAVIVDLAHFVKTTFYQLTKTSREITPKEKVVSARVISDIYKPK